MRPHLAPLLLAASSLFILACAPAQYFGRQQDDLVYVIASHALSRGGYRLFTSPADLPLTMMTPGWPLLLLPLTWLAGERYALYQAFAALLMAATPWALWLWLRRRLEEKSALLVALLWATSPMVLSQAGCVMTETPFTLAAVPFLLWVKELPRPAAAGGLLLFLTQLRPAGLALFPAALAGSLRRRRWRDAAWIGVPAAAAMSLWFAWSHAVAGSMQKVSEFALFYRDRPAADALRVLLDNLLYYLPSWGCSYLPASWGEGAGLVLGAGLGASAAWGLGKALRRDPSDPAALLLAGGMALHGAWSWHYQRYLIALLPWLLWAAALAWGRRALPILTVLLGSQLAFQSRHWLNPTAWARPELAETYAWLRAHSAPSDLLASPFYVRDGFYAARPSLPLPDDPDPAAFADRLRRWKVGLVLWQEGLDIGLSLGSDSPNYRMLYRARDFLAVGKPYRLIYENRREGSRVYALD